MPDAKRKAKLTAKQRTKVLALAAGGWNARMIADYFEEEHDIKLGIRGIHRNYLSNPRYKGRIRNISRIMEKNWAQHPLAQKSVRLDIIMTALKEALTWRTDKVYFDKWGEEIGKIDKRMIGVISNLIDQARRETEGDKDKGDTVEEVLIQLIRKSDKEPMENIDGFRIARKEHKTLDRFMAK